MRIYDTFDFSNEFLIHQSKSVCMAWCMRTLREREREEGALALRWSFSSPLFLLGLSNSASHLSVLSLYFVRMPSYSNILKLGRYFY